MTKFITPLEQEKVAANSQLLGELLAQVLTIETGIHKQMALNLGDPRIHMNRNPLYQAAKQKIETSTTFDQLAKLFQPVTLTAEAELANKVDDPQAGSRKTSRPPSAVRVNIDYGSYFYRKTVKDHFVQIKTGTPLTFSCGTVLPEIPTELSENVRRSIEINPWGSLVIVSDAPLWKAAEQSAHGDPFISKPDLGTTIACATASLGIVVAGLLMDFFAVAYGIAHPSVLAGSILCAMPLNLVFAGLLYWFVPYIWAQLKLIATQIWLNNWQKKTSATGQAVLLFKSHNDLFHLGGWEFTQS